MSRIRLFGCVNLGEVKDCRAVDFYGSVEEMPRYKGGTQAFLEHFAENFHYEPKEGEPL